MAGACNGLYGLLCFHSITCCSQIRSQASAPHRSTQKAEPTKPSSLETKVPLSDLKTNYHSARIIWGTLNVLSSAGERKWSKIDKETVSSGRVGRHQSPLLAHSALLWLTVTWKNFSLMSTMTLLRSQVRAHHSMLVLSCLPEASLRDSPYFFLHRAHQSPLEFPERYHLASSILPFLQCA